MKSTTKIQDVLGVDLEPGQVVGFAERDGNVARMRTGVIEEISDEYGKVTIRWTDDYRYGAKVSTIHYTGEVISRPRLCVIQNG